MPYVLLFGTKHAIGNLLSEFIRMRMFIWFTFFPVRIKEPGGIQRSYDSRLLIQRVAGLLPALLNKAHIRSSIINIQ